jgi:predicted transcriptional regulator
MPQGCFHFFLIANPLCGNTISMNNVSARKLDLLIKGRGLKKGDFARTNGVSPSVLSKLLKGRQMPSVSQAIQIEELTEGYVSIRGWSVEVRTDLTQSPDQCIGV